MVQCGEEVGGLQKNCVIVTVLCSVMKKAENGEEIERNGKRNEAYLVSKLVR